MEIWLPIKDFPKYAVSSDGRVKNAITGKILKPGYNPKGYQIVSLYKNGMIISYIFFMTKMKN